MIVVYCVGRGGRLALESFSKITDTAGRRCAVTSQPSSNSLGQVVSVFSCCIGVNGLGGVLDLNLIVGFNFALFDFSSVLGAAR